MLKFNSEDQEYIKEKTKLTYGIITGIDDKKKPYELGYITNINATCYCKLNKGKIFSGFHCPYCHNKVSELLPEEFRGIYSSYSVRYTGEKQFYVKPVEDGIQIINFQIQSNVIKKIETPININIKVFYYIDIKIGQNAKAYKIVRNEEVPMDIFEAFRINTKTIREGISMIYKDANNLIEFMLQNKDFAKKTGFINFINDIELEIPRDTAFMMYLYMLTEYPAIELLVKMKHTRLIQEIFKTVMNGANKEVIRKRGKEISEIVKDTTKGSLALSVPKFAADYFKEIDAPLDEYKNWSIVFSYESLGKEKFYELYQSVADINSYIFRNIAELLKYGYKLEKLITYIKKQTLLTNVLFIYTAYHEKIQLLKDYLEMSSMMGVKPDLFPSDIKTAHDNLMVAYEAKKNVLNDAELNRIATNCEKYIPEDDKYTIVIPNKTTDFIIEGREQHNCVASYVNAVLRHDCIVFFVRKKENSDESFVTAEYSSEKLCQIRSKNNNPVYQKEIIDYAESFCKKLSKNEDIILKKEA